MIRTKLGQLSLISSVWAISDSYKAKALQALEAMDVVECARRQSEFLKEIEAADALRRATAEDQKPYGMIGGLVIFNVSGPMTKKPTSASWYFGGTSTLETRDLIRQAKEDPDVKAGLMIWETPGGEVAGLPEFGDDILAFNAAKPMYSFVDDDCHSAGYYGAAHTRGIYGNEMGMTGCVGTVWAIPDTSKAYAQAGVKVKLYKTGAYKGAGTDGVPITDAQDAYFQSIVDRYGADFKARVANGRGLTADAVDAIADGRSFFAPDAYKLGLIDGICSLDECIDAILTSIDTGNPIPKGFGVPAKTTSATPPKEEAASTPPTISAQTGGSTGPTGAGKVQVPKGPGETKTMKNTLVRALAMLGLAKMATAVVSSDSEDPDSLAQTMAKQVEAEVAERVANHPLLMACEANSIKTPDQLASVLEAKIIGDKCLADMRADAISEATRAYGENGPKISAQVNTLPYNSVVLMRDAWRTEADSKFGIGANGEGATRQTATTQVKVAIDDTTADAPKTAWDRLTDAQRAQGISMGFKTPERQQAFAENLLKAVA